MFDDALGLRRFAIAAGFDKLSASPQHVEKPAVAAALWPPLGLIASRSPRSLEPRSWMMSILCRLMPSILVEDEDDIFSPIRGVPDRVVDAEEDLDIPGFPQELAKRLDRPSRARPRRRYQNQEAPFPRLLDLSPRPPLHVRFWLLPPPSRCESFL